MTKQLPSEILMQRLKAMRLERGLRQSDLAAQLGRPQSFVSKLEAGERRLGIDELFEVCVVFNVTVSSLITDLECR